MLKAIVLILNFINENKPFSPILPQKAQQNLNFRNFEHRKEILEFGKISLSLGRKFLSLEVYFCVSEFWQILPNFSQKLPDFLI